MESNRPSRWLWPGLFLLSGLAALVFGNAFLRVAGIVVIVAAALLSVAASKRHDVERQGVSERDVFAGAVAPSQDFSIVLRGYDQVAVDTLVQQASKAMVDDDPAQIAEVRFRLEQQLAAGLPISLRGYDRQQVDVILARLSAQLAEQVNPPR